MMADKRIKDVQEIHTMPTNDVIEHEESTFCECQPKWDEQNKKDFLEGKSDKMVIIHNLIRERLH